MMKMKIKMLLGMTKATNGGWADRQSPQSKNLFKIQTFNDIFEKTKKHLSRGTYKEGANAFQEE